IWMDPLMTVNSETFIHDALALAGGENVFADRVRRYPLQADLGRDAGGAGFARDGRRPKAVALAGAGFARDGRRAKAVALAGAGFARDGRSPKAVALARPAGDRDTRYPGVALSEVPPRAP